MSQSLNDRQKKRRMYNLMATLNEKKKKNINFACQSKVAGSTKWKSNNIQLARENSKLKQDIQTLGQICNDFSIKYTNMELAWRQRGEALSKVDIISRVVGKQILKLVDTLSEIRSTCQGELARPLRENSKEQTECAAHSRHTMPKVNIKRFNNLHEVTNFSSKAQLVHHVNPMVSGHPIIKPTVTLKRINLQNISQAENQIAELDTGDFEEVDLTNIVENSSSSEEEEDVIELPENSNNNTRLSCCSTDQIYQNMRLPVAEVPLERLTDSRISKLLRRMVPLSSVQSENTEILESEHNTNQSANISPLNLQDSVVHSDRFNNNNISCNGNLKRLRVMCSFPEESIKRFLNDSLSVTPIKKMSKSPTFPQHKNNSQERSLTSGQKSSESSPETNNEISAQTSGSPLTVKQIKNGCVKKYSSSRTRTSQSLDQSKNLIVALKDVGSILNNGILINLDELEGKLRINGVSTPGNAENHIKDNLNISLPELQNEDQTQLNFTTGIGIMDYSSVSLNNNNNSVAEECFPSPRDEFLKRIQSEDPLEGPSWRYQSFKYPKRKKHASTFIHRLSDGKEKPPVANERDNVTNLCQSPNKEILTVKMEIPSSPEDNEHDMEIDITSCKVLQEVKVTPQSKNSIHKEDSGVISPTSNITPGKRNTKEFIVKEDFINGHRKKIRKLSFDVSECDIDSDPEWNLKKKKSKRNISKKNKNQRNSTSKISYVKCKTMKQNGKRKSSSVSRQNSMDTITVVSPAEVYVRLNYIETEMPIEGTSEKNVRHKRRAAPASLKEPSLISKLRRAC